MVIPSVFPVTCNTSHVGPGSTFVAIKGFKHDGAVYIDEAIQRGATTVVVDHSVDCSRFPQTVARVVVDDTRLALVEFSARALGYPARKLKFIGVTGTAGKTTTTYIVEHVLKAVGYKTALMGSVKNSIGDCKDDSCLTTPEGDYIQMFLAECVKRDVEYVVMEVSSHGIALKRIYGIEFSAVGFTNLSPEHLDFHQTMDNYFATKVKLFDQIQAGGVLVVNSDNEWGIKAAHYFKDKHHDKEIITFGSNLSTEAPAHFLLSIQQNSSAGLGIELTWEKKQTTYALQTPSLFGTYNGYNISMAFLICNAIGIPPQRATDAIKTFTGVPGRLQVHTLKNGAKAFVDFAHKPGAFEEVVKTLRPLTDHLIIVFGCGGDRDRTKRPVMGKLAALYGDIVIITDDNPRTEDRLKIADEIMVGIPDAKKTSIIRELDRRKAIALAAGFAKPNSIIALLGKGHESYYLIGGQKLHLDDLEEISVF